MSGEIVVIAEKPELAKAIAEGLGGGSRKDGYFDCGQHYVAWLFGHMLELEAPETPSSMASYRSASSRGARNHRPTR